MPKVHSRPGGRRKDTVLRKSRKAGDESSCLPARETEGGSAHEHGHGMTPARPDLWRCD
jgi:hypothetical protein